MVLGETLRRGGASVRPECAPPLPPWSRWCATEPAVGKAAGAAPWWEGGGAGGGGAGACPNGIDSRLPIGSAEEEAAAAGREGAKAAKAAEEAPCEEAQVKEAASGAPLIRTVTEDEEAGAVWKVLGGKGSIPFGSITPGGACDAAGAEAPPGARLPFGANSASGA